jgi:hypothetical protein
MITRAYARGQNTPRNPRIPRTTPSDLRISGSKDHLLSPAVRGITPRKAPKLRGMRGIGFPTFCYPPQAPRSYPSCSETCLRGMRGMREIIRPKFMSRAGEKRIEERARMTL